MTEQWWRGAVIYQIYPRSFCDGNGDGVGDLAGIAEKLDHVASLEVDGIWLSPFFVSPMDDFGYDVADYTAVDPLFGTLADFDRLVARAHGLGLKVVIDLVCAHTSDRHPWFAESRASRGNARADWYCWAAPRPDGSPPNNWLSVFGGGAWSWEPRRRQYYLHHFLPSQPKLNLRHPAVIAAVQEAARFWMERGADGFRLDAVDFFGHDEALRDNPAVPPGPIPVKPYHMQRHLHDLGTAAVMAAIEGLRAVTDDYPGSVLIAEVGGETTDIPALARAGGYAALDRAGVHAAYSLSQMKARGDAATIRAAVADAEREFPDGNLVWAFSNHDVARVATRWGDGSPGAAKLYMALLLCLRGGIFVYQGEELGLPEAEIPFERLQDPYGRNYWPEFKGRDGSRTPMPWRHDEPNAGFSAASRTWLPVPETHRRAAADLQERDDASPLHTWRRFARLRRDERALRLGGLTPCDAPGQIVAFTREEANQRLLCLFNLGHEPAEFPLAGRAVTPIEGFGWSDAAGGIRLGGYGTWVGRCD